MSEADAEDAAVARARQLREQIEGLRQLAGPGEDLSPSHPTSPREFTDAAAARTADEGNDELGRENQPEAE
jgi:hypothetical protein